MHIEINDKIVVALGAIATAIIAWLLTQISSWAKGRKENNRVRKKALFYMLDIHYSLSKLTLNMDKYLDRAVDRLYENLPFEQGGMNKEQDKKYFRNFFEQQLKPFFDGLLEAKISEISIEYEKTIAELSTVNPVLAFTLSGRTELIKSSNLIDEKIEDILVDHVTEEQMEIVKQLKTFVTSEIKVDYGTTVFFLKSKIKRLAFIISPVTTYPSTLLSLRKYTASPEVSDIEQLMDRYCNFLMQIIVAETKRQNIAS